MKDESNAVQTKSGIRSKKGRGGFSYNVIRFVRAEEDGNSRRNRIPNENFKKVTGYFRGSYRELEAIKSSVQ